MATDFAFDKSFPHPILRVTERFVPEARVNPHTVKPICKCAVCSSFQRIAADVSPLQGTALGFPVFGQFDRFLHQGFDRGLNIVGTGRQWRRKTAKTASTMSQTVPRPRLF